MESVCPICLQNLSILDCCKHSFCKTCIMAWMKNTEACPLCKRTVRVIIADIQSPSQYSQFLPDGSFLHSHYNPKRKAVYSLGLDPVPLYDGEIPTKSTKKCAIMKEWVEREIETLLPGCDNRFVVSMIMEGIERYGSRHEYVRKSITDILGENTSVFIRELESCYYSKCKSLSEFDEIIVYCIAPIISDLTPREVISYLDEYSMIVKEYEAVDEELRLLVESDRSISKLADKREILLSNMQWTKQEKEEKESEIKRSCEANSVDDFEYDFDY